jgi:hypothetical protein
VSEIHHDRPKELAVLVYSADCLASCLRDSVEDTRAAIKKILLRQTAQVRKTWKTRALRDQPTIITKSEFLRGDFLDKISQYCAQYCTNGIVRSSSLLFGNRGNVNMRLFVDVEDYIRGDDYERGIAVYFRGIEQRGHRQG